MLHSVSISRSLSRSAKRRRYVFQFHAIFVVILASSAFLKGKNEEQHRQTLANRVESGFPSMTMKIETLEIKRQVSSGIKEGRILDRLDRNWKTIRNRTREKLGEKA